ncbi:replication initiation protein RepC [Pararhodobacter marinus]|uniref:replication initiation protein RepC n=1 Tax=Pararhodobacter marinus TaxID=2184063 RepID=UPI003516BB50
MAFQHSSAALSLRDGLAVSADNAKQPERHIVIDLLCQAAPLLGLKSPVITTLDAMLSCLPPQRTHHTVFASNATLSFRRNGISDRTIRRHVALLMELGLLNRNDSPNRKRFMRTNAREGTALRFGFDLAPLFNRLSEIAHLAAEAVRDAEQIAYLKSRIRALASKQLAEHPEDPLPHAVLKTLRRKLTIKELEALLQTLDQAVIETQIDVLDEPQHTAETTDLADSNGQNVRHHHKSTKEHIDKKHPVSALSVNDIVVACSEVAEFSLRPIRTEGDVIAHARTMAPMVGIDATTYERAVSTLDPMRAALAVWIVVKFHERVRSAGAYFRAITSGARSEGFDPYSLIRRLCGTAAQAWA